MREIRNKLWLMNKRKCSLCGRFMRLYDVTIDHIVPKSKGGINHVSNYQPAHGRCNSLKGNTPPEDFKLKLAHLIKKQRKSLPSLVGITSKELFRMTPDERWMFLFGEPLPEKYKTVEN